MEHASVLNFCFTDIKIIFALKEIFQAKTHTKKEKYNFLNLCTSNVDSK